MESLCQSFQEWASQQIQFKYSGQIQVFQAIREGWLGKNALNKGTMIPRTTANYFWMGKEGNNEGVGMVK